MRHRWAAATQSYRYCLPGFGVCLTLALKALAILPPNKPIRASGKLSAAHRLGPVSHRMSKNIWKTSDS